jgi:cytidylate kinase
MKSEALKQRLLITISGPAGAGKSHCTKALSDAFGLPTHSAGSIFRRLAAERGVTIEELTKLAQKDDAIDREIDRRTEELAKTGGAILEGRLVAFFSPPGTRRLSFFLTAPLDQRIMRIADREGVTFQEAKRRTIARENGEKRRYKKIYGLDLTDLSRYDFVVNTSLWGKDAIAELLKGIVDLYLSQKASSGRTEWDKTEERGMSRDDGR